MKTRLHKITGIIAGCCLALAVNNTATAAAGQILPDETLGEADAESIKAEAKLFDRIKDGVMLSLAECELTETCSPSVNASEVEAILLKIDTRITKLTGRYTETNNKVIEEALLIYADAREGYVEVLDKLEALTEDVEGDAFGGESGEVDFSDLFKDVDEDL